jgi:hypothetical protein
MSKTQPTTEEQPKKQIANKVITPKRKYFVPSTGRTVEAESLADAVTESEKTKQEKVGDE